MFKFFLCKQRRVDEKKNQNSSFNKYKKKLVSMHRLYNVALLKKHCARKAGVINFLCSVQVNEKPEAQTFKNTIDSIHQFKKLKAVKFF